MEDENWKTRVHYAEELVREFLLFRGFTATLRSFEADLSSDHAHAFEVDQILNLFFSHYIPRFESDKLHSLLSFLQKCFFSPHDARHAVALRKFETSLKRYYIVYALQKGRVDRVLEFFQRHGGSLLQSDEDWQAWFALPYIKSPHLDSHFRIYFSKDWLDMLITSFGNFLNEVFNGIRLPALVRVSSDLMREKALGHKVKQISSDYEQLQTMLAVKEQEICELKRVLERVGAIDGAGTKGVHTLCYDVSSQAHTATRLQEEPSTSNKLEESKSSCGLIKALSATSSSNLGITQPDCVDCSLREEYPEVSISNQETFSGHTSPISRCRFSAEGGSIASASVDGTVRVWNSDTESSTSRNATIYCGAEVLSLEWDYKSDRLLLIGTAECGIKAWNVDAKRVVCDLTTDAEYPRILDLKCSPVEPIFASAASSTGHRRQSCEGKEGLALLTLWNMKSWKPLTFLPLGEDPPTITSICFNHNGKILAAGATDGMIHLFDTYGGLPITGWPAHDSAVSCVKFGPDQASIFSLGAEGKVLEWSLHNQGVILQEHDASRFCHVDEPHVPRHEMALDAQGKMLLLTSNSSASPVVHLHKKKSIQRTLQHNASITSVDWHPSQNKFLTGSVDHSVRITSLVQS